MTKTFGSLFSGAGGADVGMHQLGYHQLFGCEVDEKVRCVHQHVTATYGDSGHMFTDVLNAHPADYPDVDILWASPMCTNFSAAKRNGSESQGDISLARAIARVIKEKHPDYFFLENVSSYSRGTSFSVITQMLERCGYTWDFRTYSMAHHGFYQDRKRLVLRAVLSKNTLLPIAIDNKMQMFFRDFADYPSINNHPVKSWWRLLRHISSGEHTEATQKQSLAISQKGVTFKYPFIIERFGYSNRLPIIRYRDEPVITIRAAHGSDGRGSFRSPLTIWNPISQKFFSVTLHRLSLLQGFPRDCYKDWKGWGLRSGDVGHTIGNAVPPPFAKWIVGETIKSVEV